MLMKEESISIHCPSAFLGNIIEFYKRDGIWKRKQEMKSEHKGGITDIQVYLHAILESLTFVLYVGT
jgi:hypothetical protein